MRRQGKVLENAGVHSVRIERTEKVWVAASRVLNPGAVYGGAIDASECVLETDGGDKASDDDVAG